MLILSQSVAGARGVCVIASWFFRVPHVVVLALPAITMNSTGNSSSILKEGKLKPGIYKIQNIQSQTYLDVEVHSRGVCCRPAKDIEEGRGLVSRYLSFLVRV